MAPSYFAAQSDDRKRSHLLRFVVVRSNLSSACQVMIPAITSECNRSLSRPRFSLTGADSDRIMDATCVLSGAATLHGVLYPASVASGVGRGVRPVMEGRPRL